MGALKSAFDDPSLRAYANEQGDGSDSLIVPLESGSTAAGSSRVEREPMMSAH